MIETLIKSAALMTCILGAWLLVQAAWRKVFAEVADEQSTVCPGWNCNACHDKSRCGVDSRKQTFNRNKLDETGDESNATTGL